MRAAKGFSVGAESSARGAEGAHSMAGWRAWFGALAGRIGAALAALRHQPSVRQRALIVAAAVLVAAYALGVLAYVLLTPEIGIRCAFTPVVNHFFADYLDEGEAPRPGDRIVRVGGHEVASWPQLLRLLHDLRRDFPDEADADHRARDGELLVRVQFERPGEEGLSSAWLRLGRPPVEALLPTLLWLLLKVGLFLVGALVFWQRPEDRSAAQFFRLCLLSLGAYLGGYHWWRIVTQPALLLVFMASAVLLPAVTLHFYLLFPRPKPLLERRPRLVLMLIYGPPTLMLLLLLSGYLRVRWLAGVGAGAASVEAVRLLLGEMLVEIYVCFGLAAAWYVAGVACLVDSFRRAQDDTERNQVKWVLFGSAAALVPIGYSLYLAFLRQERFGGGAATWPMFAASACVTVAFTVSITRYRLMQLDQIISSGAVYFVISSLAGVVYYGLVFVGMLLLGGRGAGGPSLGGALGVSTAALVLLVALDLARGRLKRALDKRFRREKYQLDRTLHRMRQAIDRLEGPEALGRRLLHTAAELLGAPTGAVYLRPGGPPLYRLAEALGPPPPLTELSSGCPLVEALRARGALSPPRGDGDAGARQLLFLGGATAHALLHEGELLGLLVLGPRSAGPYTPEDLSVLNAFAGLTAVALASAERHRTIEMLNRDLQGKVEKIAEQQRRILALQTQLTQKSEVRSRRSEGGGGGEAPAAQPAAVLPPCGWVGSSPQARELLGLVKKVAATQTVVLLRGESGTGKEVLARLLHENSPRAPRPFVKVHCAALSPLLLESELFGHVKGAFTNAIRDKVGRFEAADGGTLLLDEIGDVSLDVQTKLLRVLQEMTIERVGSSEPVRVDVRVVAATHQDLEGLIRQGRFREDLFYRLNVFPIRLPPLRDRPEDVPELAQHFVRLLAARAGKALDGLDDDALAVLKGCPWPGNVRQLENVIQRAVVVAEGPALTVADLPPEVVEAAGPLPDEPPDDVLTDGTAPLGPALRAELADREKREREYLVRALAAAGGNKAEAARALGMARSTLLSRLKRLGLG
jgi:transcriptional regulator with GAF, ATPase, and Fis domain